MTERPFAVDLFCGRGGWTRGLLAHGFDVVGVDLLPQPGYPVGPASAFLQADIRTLHAWDLPRRRPFAVIGSPPCQPFSTMRPGNQQPPTPEGFELVAHAFRVVAELRPTYWAVENVRGALKWWAPAFGAPDVRDNPYYLWGHLPTDFRPPGRYPSKLRYRDPGRRSEIPFSLADALAASLRAAWCASIERPAEAPCDRADVRHLADSSAGDRAAVRTAVEARFDSALGRTVAAPKIEPVNAETLD